MGRWLASLTKDSDKDIQNGGDIELTKPTKQVLSVSSATRSCVFEEFSGAGERHLADGPGTQTISENAINHLVPPAKSDDYEHQEVSSVLSATARCGPHKHCAGDKAAPKTIIPLSGSSPDSIPACYQHDWARLNHHKPKRFSEAEWLQALDDGARFLDAWGRVVESGWAWTTSELFEIPGPGEPGGLIWRLHGRAVIAYGPDYVRLNDDAIIRRG